ncbi:sugar phosphate nucleotidyltransferase [Desulfosporosinus sp. FKA]|uniref:sugar phosphate nucleotidyltransferase n=1 Tax=Desulfosporosinus sp. FKA TaxID=1969834 RepID=UPI000B4A5542|nr:sugar phosphate nucleotidyltransferase [Desulfosporosinus sp. FKA]
MKLILLSGGSGKRLWPLSNDTRSKQFLQVLRSELGEPQSMVERVWSQLESSSLKEVSYIATSKSQVDIIQNQLGTDVKLIVEPERRDTFPAIALSCSYLYSVEGIGLDEVVAVLPVDPYVETGFFEGVKDLEEVLQDSWTELALMGVVPTYPSEKYGYIVPEGGQGNQRYVRVSHFREKPKGEQAAELIEQQALWNCGVFAFRLEFVIKKIEELGFSPNYEALREDYSKLPKISFDYQVVEKAKHIAALRYDGDWKDLGTWNTLTEEMSGVLIGNGVLSEDSLNTHLINELDIPITVLGLSDIVVAASPDGILVSDKKASPRVKEVINGLTGRPMFEERRWGWYKVLDHTKSPEGQEVLTKRIGIKAGKNLSYQMHYFRSEVWTIVSGIGEFVLDGVIYPVKPGDVLNIQVQTKHGIRAVTDLEFIEVQLGKELVEEDIVRLFMTWAEVEEYCVRQTEHPLAEKMG